MMELRGVPTESLAGQIQRLAEEGKTCVIVARGREPLGLIALADVLKPSAAEAVSMLQKMGLKVVIMTGDNESIARAIGRSVGVDRVGRCPAWGKGRRGAPHAGSRGDGRHGGRWNQ